MTESNFNLIKFVSENRGDIINVVGIIVGLVGFGITIWQLWRTKKAAKAAEHAAVQTQNELRYLDTVMDFSTVITMMEEIKRHHRSSNWTILPERYSVLRQKLIAIRVNNAHLGDAQKATILEAIQALSDMENIVEGTLLKKKAPPRAYRFNETVSGHMDALNEILMEIKNKLEVKSNGESEINRTN